MDERPRLVTVVLEVADLDRSVALYRDAFGVELEVADHRGGEHGADDRWISGRHAATSWTEGAFLHLALYEAKEVPTKGVQVAFRVDDVFAAHRRALEGGAEIVHGPREEPWGTSARYRDLDGNIVELTSPVS